MNKHLQKLAAAAIACRQKVAALVVGWRPDALMVSGAVGVSYGAWSIYAPAGWIVGGLFSLTAGWILARKGGQ